MADDRDSDNLSPQRKGGLARARLLSPEARQDIARTAARQRWHGPSLQATHEGDLQIGDFTLQCAVLTDGRRVLSERGVLRTFGLTRGGTTYQAAQAGVPAEQGGGRLPLFLAAANLRPFIDNDLQVVVTQPVVYRNKGNATAFGLEASLIPKVCEVWLKARDSGVLSTRQLEIAARADTLIRGLARTGIIALVDEATGYQEVRDRKALQAVLDAYLSRELAAWAKRFPDAFYDEIFRLRKWSRAEIKGKASAGGAGPRVIGKYTNDIVYARLAPGLLAELQQRNPVTERGQRRARHHQWFSDEVGHPALSQHLHAVVGLLKAAETWEQFQRMLERAFPVRTSLDDLPLFQQDVRADSSPPGDGQR